MAQIGKRGDGGVLTSYEFITEDMIDAWQKDGEKYRDPGLYCPESGCEYRLTPVRSYRNASGTFVPLHLSHPPGSGGCGGDKTAISGGGGVGGGTGESLEHVQMKAITVAKLRAMFPEDETNDEVHIDVNEPPSPTTDRKYTDERSIDVAIQFEKPLGDASEFEARIDRDGPGWDPATDSPVAYEGLIGDKLAIECQWKNSSKDVTAVTEQYLDAGWSVLWLYPEHFTGIEAEHQSESGDIDLRRGQWVPVWPNAAPDHPHAEGYRHRVRWSAKTRWVDNCSIHARGGKHHESVWHQFSIEMSVPATFHLDRWVRDLDELPHPGAWGYRADLAGYAYGYEPQVPLGKVGEPDASHFTSLFDRAQEDVQDERNVRVPMQTTPEICDELARKLWNSRPWRDIVSSNEYRVDGFLNGEAVEPDEKSSEQADTYGVHTLEKLSHLANLGESAVSHAFASFPLEWFEDEMHEAFEHGKYIGQYESLLDMFDDPEVHIRCPGHPPRIARERIESGRICGPHKHDWVELRRYYWRECRTCGLNDVTCKDIGQPVETPNVH